MPQPASATEIRDTRSRCVVPSDVRGPAPEHPTCHGPANGVLTSLQARIWPLAFFTRRSFLRKYLQAPGSVRVWLSAYDDACLLTRSACTQANLHTCRQPGTRMRRCAALSCPRAASPELALCLDIVLRPDLHPVDGGGGIGGGGQMAPHHLVLVELEAALRCGARTLA
jgi:hypothetical protein